MSVATTNYTLRLDEADKQQAEQVFKSLGMSFAAGLNAYIKMVVRQQRIPFDLALTTKSNDVEVARAERERSFMALRGILAKHEVDLDKEREERIMAQ